MTLLICHVMVSPDGIEDCHDDATGKDDNPGEEKDVSDEDEDHASCDKGNGVDETVQNAHYFLTNPASDAAHGASIHFMASGTGCQDGHDQDHQGQGGHGRTQDDKGQLSRLHPESDQGF